MLRTERGAESQRWATFRRGARWLAKRRRKAIERLANERTLLWEMGLELESPGKCVYYETLVTNVNTTTLLPRFRS
jgi:hypothetical protein